MDTKQKTRAGLAGGLAALALVVGGASIASGDTPSSASPSAAPSQGQTRSDHHPCPKEGKGKDSAPSSSSETTTAQPPQT